ncbi:hypothetical protein CA54_20570 [Symmachiella macrocystis]|uniref:Uncharacterized protein n=1 Tax=Symmachiella macrocystis TaxID=2527985 RepID=A0A5C6BMH6_9PLAN|nr:hypothetical protein [Symmachiella macrocystis]TWU13225.1 hypothetical protein CA54_20570 [Symmachiella macrocystis]
MSRVKIEDLSVERTLEESETSDIVGAGGFAVHSGPYGGGVHWNGGSIHWGGGGGYYRRPWRGHHGGHHGGGHRGGHWGGHRGGHRGGHWGGHRGGHRGGHGGGHHHHGGRRRP